MYIYIYIYTHTYTQQLSLRRRRSLTISGVSGGCVEVSLDLDQVLARLRRCPYTYPAAMDVQCHVAMSRERPQALFVSLVLVLKLELVLVFVIV